MNLLLITRIFADTSHVHCSLGSSSIWNFTLLPSYFDILGYSCVSSKAHKSRKYISICIAVFVRFVYQFNICHQIYRYESSVTLKGLLHRSWNKMPSATRGFNITLTKGMLEIQSIDAIICKTVFIFLARVSVGRLKFSNNRP